LRQCLPGVVTSWIDVIGILLPFQSPTLPVYKMSWVGFMPAKPDASCARTPLLSSHSGLAASNWLSSPPRIKCRSAFLHHLPCTSTADTATANKRPITVTRCVAEGRQLQRVDTPSESLVDQFPASSSSSTSLAMSGFHFGISRKSWPGIAQIFKAHSR